MKVELNDLERDFLHELDKLITSHIPLIGSGIIGYLLSEKVTKMMEMADAPGFKKLEKKNEELENYIAALENAMRNAIDDAREELDLTSIQRHLGINR